MAYEDMLVQRIRYFLKERDISLNKLANMSGVAQSTLDNVMHKGSKSPTLKTIHRVANGLGMTVAEFLDYPEMNEYSFEEEKESPPAE